MITHFSQSNNWPFDIYWDLNEVRSAEFWSVLRSLIGVSIRYWIIQWFDMFTGSIKLSCNLWWHNTPNDKDENSLVVLISARLHFEGFQWSRIGWFGQPIRWKKFWNLPFWLCQDMIGYLWIPLQELIKFGSKAKSNASQKDIKLPVAPTFETRMTLELLKISNHG